MAGLDARAREWLSRDALRGQEIVRARPLAGGFRNENILLATAAGQRYVLRRYLRGNTCAVEVALAARLAGVVPVAEVVAADPAGTPPLLLSRFVPGDLVSAILPGLSAGEAEGLGRACGVALAAIGSVFFERPGFFTDPGLVPDGTEPTAGLPAFVDRCLESGNAAGALTVAERAALRRRADEVAPSLRAVAGSRRLVHSDFNPKNLLAARRGGRWVITAVLDWEFSFSSSPLFDVGNMLRFHAELPPGFAAGFIAGYRADGGQLPENWRELSQALDLFALADFLTRPLDNPFRAKAATLIRGYLGRPLARRPAAGLFRDRNISYVVLRMPHQPPEKRRSRPAMLVVIMVGVTPSIKEHHRCDTDHDQLRGLRGQASCAEPFKVKFRAGSKGPQRIKRPRRIEVPGGFAWTVLGLNQ